MEQLLKHKLALVMLIMNILKVNNWNLFSTLTGSMINIFIEHHLNFHDWNIEINLKIRIKWEDNILSAIVFLFQRICLWSSRAALAPKFSNFAFFKFEGSRVKNFSWKAFFMLNTLEKSGNFMFKNLEKSGKSQEILKSQKLVTLWKIYRLSTFRENTADLQQCHVF